MRCKRLNKLASQQNGWASGLLLCEHCGTRSKQYSLTEAAPRQHCLPLPTAARRDNGGGRGQDEPHLTGIVLKNSHPLARRAPVPSKQTVAPPYLSCRSRMLQESTPSELSRSLSALTCHCQLLTEAAACDQATSREQSKLTPCSVAISPQIHAKFIRQVQARSN